MSQAVRSYIAEFVGTFALVFIGTAVATLQSFAGSLSPSGWLGISFAFGGALAVLVWTIGPVSGCHINPAVSIPMALSGRLPWSRLPGYLVSQILGGLAASFVLLTLIKSIPGYDVAKHGLAANGNALKMDDMALFGWELLMTALFLLTIFTVTRKGADPGFHALAIGGFLFISHVVGAQLGDSSLNPARSIGPAVVSNQNLDVLWVFIAGPVVGGLVGWQLFNLLHSDRS